jgi:SAM-dependent methyltransferase
VFELLFNEWNFRRLEERRTVLRWLNARAGEKVLDVGCGYGYNDRIISRAGAHVVGIDVDPRRLAVAQSTNASPRTEFRLMDAEVMDFAEASFDKVVSFCTIEHFSRDDRVLAHVYRVLRPGGLLVLSADSLSNPEIEEQERAAHRRRYNVQRYYTAQTLRRKLEGVGFRVERSRYALSSPVSLALVRVSWALDGLPASLLPLKVTGYVVLATVGRVIADAAEHLVDRKRSGLTLLAQARRPVRAVRLDVPRHGEPLLPPSPATTFTRRPPERHED